MSEATAMPDRRITIGVNLPSMMGKPEVRASVLGKGQFAPGQVSLTLVDDGPAWVYTYVNTPSVKIERRYFLRCDAQGELTIEPM